MFSSKRLVGFFNAKPPKGKSGGPPAPAAPAAPKEKTILDLKLERNPGIAGKPEDFPLGVPPKFWTGDDLMDIRSPKIEPMFHFYARKMRDIFIKEGYMP